MSDGWRTVTLPKSVIEEIENNLEGYTSKSEFIRAAVRFYIESRRTRMEAAHN